MPEPTDDVLATRASRGRRGGLDLAEGPSNEPTDRSSRHCRVEGYGHESGDGADGVDVDGPRPETWLARPSLVSRADDPWAARRPPDRPDVVGARTVLGRAASSGRTRGVMAHISRVESPLLPSPPHWCGASTSHSPLPCTPLVRRVGRHAIAPSFAARWLGCATRDRRRPWARRGRRGRGAPSASESVPAHRAAVPGLPRWLAAAAVTAAASTSCRPDPSPPGRAATVGQRLSRLEPSMAARRLVAPTLTPPARPLDDMGTTKRVRLALLADLDTIGAPCARGDRKSSSAAPRRSTPWVRRTSARWAARLAAHLARALLDDAAAEQVL